MVLQDLIPGDVFIDSDDCLMLAIKGTSDEIECCYLTDYSSSTTFSPNMEISRCTDGITPVKVICNLMKPFFDLQLALHERGILGGTKEE